ncbi:Lysine-specific demethylase 4A [Hondaea fermentalgiana]|uniref:Lysine-specific demethylase 4A n=1 Tax=Hondaea fermentalgiana TaxID=2315210 RepID=A0A2R5GAN5_9STRA|nr:Lysine-specific demethylase 4A [Hondaea fermentalgiana]|eukprot:GBG28067.1 Lysine-specific demethylase 4A [Hondaea fermentalgiana]
MPRVTRTRSGAAKTASRQGLQLEAPVFRPTMEEFQDFERFVEKIEVAGAKAGLVKVIPPKEWGWKMHPNAFLARHDQEVKRLIKPIRQFSSGRKGAYKIDIVESRKRAVGDFWEDAHREDLKRKSVAREPDANAVFWSGTWTWLAKATSQENNEKDESGPVRLKGSWAKTPKDQQAKDASSVPFSLDLAPFSDSDLDQRDSKQDDQIVEQAPERDARAPQCFRGSGNFHRENGDIDHCTLYLIEHIVSEARGSLQDTKARKHPDFHLEGYGVHGNKVYRLTGELRAPTSDNGNDDGGDHVRPTFWLSCTYPSTENEKPAAKKRRLAQERQSPAAEEDSASPSATPASASASLSSSLSPTDNNDLTNERCAHAKQVLEFDPRAIRAKVELDDADLIESFFWKEIGANSKPCMYGGDQVGTVFGDATHMDAGSWNLDKLDTILRVGFGPGREAKGITTSMLYFGMWRAMFAWHTEDMELNSVNFLHYGAPKYWYAVPPAHATRMELISRSEFGGEANICSEFLRHKNVMIAPSVLLREKIPFVRAVQHVGEFMFTFPRAYHGGFNLGFNVAEAVNFATPRWLGFGRRATWCKCEKWTFRLDVDDFVERVRYHAPKRLPAEPFEGDRIFFRYDANDLVPCGRVGRRKSAHNPAPKTMMLVRRPRHKKTENDEQDDNEGKRRSSPRANNNSANDKAMRDAASDSVESGNDADADADEETLEPDMRCALMRITKGKNGAPFMVVPVNWDEVPFARAPFYPDEDDWFWPQPAEPDATDDEAGERVGPTDAADSSDDAGQLDETRRLARRERWDMLNWTRRNRIIVRKAKVLHKADPLVFACMLQLVQQDDNSDDPEAVSRAINKLQSRVHNNAPGFNARSPVGTPKNATMSKEATAGKTPSASKRVNYNLHIVPPERVKILHHLKASRTQRRRMRRERAQAAIAATFAAPLAAATS